MILGTHSYSNACLLSNIRKWTDKQIKIPHHSWVFFAKRWGKIASTKNIVFFIIKTLFTGCLYQFSFRVSLSECLPGRVAELFQCDVPIAIAVRKHYHLLKRGRKTTELTPQWMRLDRKKRINSQDSTLKVYVLVYCNLNLFFFS